MNPPDILFQGKIFRVEQVLQTTPDGKEHVRQVVRHPGAVVVLPLLDDGRVCLVRNYRAAVDESLIELPAGTLEPNEPPEDTARRELAEETGYRAGRIERLLIFYMSPGILDERMHLFLADRLRPGPTALEAGEDIQTLLFTWDETMQMVRRGEIRDSKTLVSLLFYKDRLGSQS
ncbi:MAG: NUDIX hydrolase [Pirellulales bacterium]|nr:NUDIX hydrolase [Pirellulales bacterium]